MNIEKLRKFCIALSYVTEDIKWDNDLCFCIGGKMFCVTGLNGPFGISFKVRDKEFVELIETDGIIPAAYVARYKWITVQKQGRFNNNEWEYYIRQSYELIKSRFPKKIREKLN